MDAEKEVIIGDTDILCKMNKWNATVGVINILIALYAAMSNHPELN